MRLTPNSISCGVFNLSGLSRWRVFGFEVLIEFLGRWMKFHDWKPGAFLFSDLATSPGSDLAKFITDGGDKYGVVTKSSEFINPNSGSLITVWVWDISKATAFPKVTKKNQCADDLSKMVSSSLIGEFAQKDDPESIHRYRTDWDYSTKAWEMCYKAHSVAF